MEIFIHSMLLNIILFLPALSTLLMFLLPNNHVARYYAIIVAACEFALTLVLWACFGEEVGFKFITNIPFGLGISYCIGIDGISLFLVVLSALITLLGIILLDKVENIKNFLAALLLLETITIGVFVALDMLLFYVFWELSLIPMMYIIGAWGGEKKIYASIKFFLYTFGASIIMLFGILYFANIYYHVYDVWSFNLLDWYMLQLNNIDIQKMLFIAFFIGIAVKVPMFPLHTWLPYAHGQAPTIGSVVLAAILLKMGSYAFIRLSLPLFPDASIAFIVPIAIICMIMIIYAALVSFAQDDMKQVIAYSSISHMGIVVLGTFALNVEGISGSVFMMISHGIVSGALFMIVGVLYDRTHTKIIARYGGVARAMPQFTIISAIVLMGSVGLPLTIGFVGEFLSLFGFFKANIIITIFAASGIVVGAVYMLHLFRRVFLGSAKEHVLCDINKRELIALVPLALIVVWLGIYPKPLLSKIDPAAELLVSFMYKKAILPESKEFLINVNMRSNNADF